MKELKKKTRITTKSHELTISQSQDKTNKIADTIYLF